LLDIFDRVEYIIWLNVRVSRVVVVLKEGCRGQRGVLKAWFHALLVAWLWDERRVKERGELSEGEVGRKIGEGGDDSVWGLLEESVAFVSREWTGVEEALVRSGWEVDVEAILVSGKGRVRIKNN
jgi:hypothetical protein